MTERRKPALITPASDDAAEAARLRLELNSLRTELEFKNQMIRLLNQVNANMRASFKSREVHYLVLMSVILGPGLRMNRAMLFVRHPKERVLEGAMALSPESVEELNDFYAEADERKIGLEDYLKRFYENDLKVKNRLSKMVTTIRCERKAPNFLNAVLNAKQARYFRKARAEDFKGLGALRRELKGEFIAAPIFYGNEELGVIVADNRFTRKNLAPGDVTALQTLCKFASSMMTTARKVEEAEKLSIEDELTGAANYRELRDRTEHEIERGKRYHRRFSLSLIDIDDFSLFNESNGHVTGNKLLIDLVAAVRSRIRNVDLLARYGGEKFCVLMPETEKNGALVATEKIRSLIRRRKFTGMEKLPHGRVTVSAGVATYPEDGRDFDALIGYLSRLLHLAKAGGKDTVQAESLEMSMRKKAAKRPRGR